MGAWIHAALRWLVALLAVLACVGSSIVGAHLPVRAAPPDLTARHSAASPGEAEASAALTQDAARDGLDFRLEGGRLAVLDVSDPSNPGRLGQTEPLSLRAWDVVRGPGVVYLPSDRNDVLVVDVSDPAQAAEVASFRPTSGVLVGLAVAGRLAFAAQDYVVPSFDRRVGEAGLRVLTLEDPRRPSELAFFALPDTVRLVTGVAVDPDRPDRVYLSDSDGLRALDVSDPRHPVELGTYPLPTGSSPGGARGSSGTAARGDHVYLRREGRRASLSISVIDVADPARMQRRATYVGQPYGVRLGDGVALVSHISSVDLLDTRDPTRPRRITTVTGAPGASPPQVTLAAGHAVVWRPTGPEVLDLAAMLAASAAEPLPFPRFHGAEPVAHVGGPSYAVAQSGSLALIGMGHRLVALDVSDPARPRQLGITEPLGAVPQRILLSGSRAIVGANTLPDGYGNRAHAVIVFDLSDPARLREVGRYEARGSLFGMALAGESVLLTEEVYDQGVNGGAGMRILDVRATPRSVAFAPLDVTLPPGEVAVAGHIAYVAGSSLSAFDVSQPAAPRLNGQLPVRGIPRGVAIAGDMLLVSTYLPGQFDNPPGGELYAFDVASPTHPLLLGSLATRGPRARVTIDGARTYLLHDTGSTGGAGVGVFDVRDPGAMAWLGEFPARGSVHGVAVSQGIAYLAAPSGLIVTDVKDPARPQDLGSFDRPRVSEIAVRAVDGRYGYGVDRGSVVVLDFADPAAPRIAASVPDAVPPGRLLRQVAASAGRIVLVHERPAARAGERGSLALQVAHATEGGTWRLGGSLTLGDGASLTALTLDGPHAFLGIRTPASPGSTAAQYEIRAVDLADLAAPRAAGAVTVPGSVSTLVIAPATRVLYASVTPTGSAGSAATVLAVDVADPAQMSVKDLAAPLPGRPFASHGTVLYTQTAGGITSVDVADPLRPQSLGTYPTRGSLFAVRGATVYASDSRTGRVEAVDFSDEANPIVRARFDWPGATTWHLAALETDYLIGEGHGLNVVRVGRPHP